MKKCEFQVIYTCASRDVLVVLLEVSTTKKVNSLTLSSTTQGCYHYCTSTHFRLSLQARRQGWFGGFRRTAHCACSKHEKLLSAFTHTLCMDRIHKTVALFIRSHTSSLVINLYSSQHGSYTAHVCDYSMLKFNLHTLINN